VRMKPMAPKQTINVYHEACVLVLKFRIVMHRGANEKAHISTKELLHLLLPREIQKIIRDMPYFLIVYI
jgi:hypothetical protein